MNRSRPPTACGPCVFSRTSCVLYTISTPTLQLVQWNLIRGDLEIGDPPNLLFPIDPRGIADDLSLDLQDGFAISLLLVLPLHQHSIHSSAFPALELSVLCVSAWGNT